MLKFKKHIPSDNFEKARLEYCLALFEREEKGREELEKKSQFYLSLITLSLGAFFLNIENLKKLKDAVFTPHISRSLVVAVNISLVVLLLALMISLVFVLISFSIRTYHAAAPNNLVVKLFSPDSTYLDERTEKDALKAFATEYALAFEQNSRTNERKAQWVQAAGIGIFISVLTLAALTAEIFLVLFQ